MDIVFENSRYLAFLLFVPIIIFVHYFSMRFFRKKSVPFANFETIRRISKKYLFTQNHTQLVLRIVIVVVLCFILAGMKLVYTSDTANPNTVFLIDASDSMFLVQNDLFGAGKQIYEDYARSHNYVSSIGVITYSATSVVAIPPTDSRTKALNSISNLQKHEVSGTDIGTSLLNSLFLASTQEGSTQVILISDGKGVFGTALSSALDFSSAKHIPITVVILGETYNENIYDSLFEVTKKTGGSLYETPLTTDDRDFEIETIVSNLLLAKDTLVVLDIKFHLLLFCLVLLVLEWALAKSIYKIIPY